MLSIIFGFWEEERAGPRHRIVRISRSLEVLYLSGCSFWPPVVRALKILFASCSLNVACIAESASDIQVECDQSGKATYLLMRITSNNHQPRDHIVLCP